MTNAPIRATGSLMVCPPEGSSIHQAVAIALNHLKAMPENWHYVAAPFVFASCQKAWPCK